MGLYLAVIGFDHSNLALNFSLKLGKTLWAISCCSKNSLVSSLENALSNSTVLLALIGYQITSQIELF